MNLQDYANLGMAAMTGDPAYARTVAGHAKKEAKESSRLSHLAAFAVASGQDGQPASVGWAPPSITYDKMRQTNASALALDVDIQANVSRPAFKEAWGQWFASWKAFMGKYQGGLAKLGAAFYSEQLSDQAESYRVQLEGWFAGYAREKASDGTPVPPSTAPLPPKSILAPADEKQAGGVPWWIISLLTIGVISVGVAVAFSVRRAYRDTEAKREVLEKKVLPIVLGSQLGPAGVALAEAASARGRDPESPQAHVPHMLMQGDPRYVPLYLDRPYGTLYHTDDTEE